MTTSAIYISRFTKPHLSFNLKTKTQNKKLQWLQIQNVPTKLISEYNEYYVMNSFTSANSSYFLIKKESFIGNFDKAIITDNVIYNSCYPVPIHIDEFNKRMLISKFSSGLKKLYTKLEGTQLVMKTILDNKLFQLIQSQGASYITIEQYTSYKEGTLQFSKHKRFGNDIFNRNCRWCPPIDLSYNEFEKNSSYPAPLGIRPKDFCLPSVLIDTICNLIIQIFKFENVTSESIDIMNTFLNEYGDYKIDKSTPLHTCKYCNKTLNVLEYSSTYKSEDNYIEICHRDPNSNFNKENMYWGHGECNRRQGGYSENERIKDGIHLLNSQTECYDLSEEEKLLIQTLCLKLSIK